MKSMSSAMRVLTVVLGISIAGCATSFSPERVRGEIATQTGQDPRYVFEIQLGRVTMHRIRAGLAGGGAALPLAGLNEFDLAFYDVPMGASLDFTRMAVRGWEPVVRTRQPGRSALVLVREAGATTVSDLVLLGAGESGAIYARLKGTLSPELPRALGNAFENRGPEGLRDELVRGLIRQR
jgi:hypothetical protein